MIALSACGGSSEATSDDEIASLETDEFAEDGDPNDADTGELRADEAALEFSECLRGEGFDVPDIGVDSDGNIQLREAFANIDRQDGSFRDGMEACADILEGVGFGGGGRGAFDDNTEIADAFLEFSDCVRAEGFEDIPDLTLGAPGGGEGPGEGGAPAEGGPGSGEREGGFGDRSALFAEGLGLDADDEDVIAALDVCSPIIDQAFSDAGIGEPGGN